MLEQASVEEMFQKYGEMLYKICIVMLKNTYDAEDTVQDVLIKYMTKKPLFETYEHEKAWLIRVTINLCKDKLRFYKQHPYINIETIKTTYPEDSIDNQILAILLELPSKYKEVLLLYYVEGYKCFEISKILKITESTVKKRLERGRKLCIIASHQKKKIVFLQFTKKGKKYIGFPSQIHLDKFIVAKMRS